MYAEFGYDCDSYLADADGDDVCNPFEVTGCTNPNACNYNPEATEENGSCTYPEFGYACDGTCLEDTDSDGICDASEIAGCTDPTACNYSSSATDNDGSCTYEDDVYDCDGNCIDDADGDGICDALEIPGCEMRQQLQCRCHRQQWLVHLPATVVLGLQEIASDQDGDGLCDEQEGCLDEAACNFNPNALEDDGSYYADFGFVATAIA